MYLEFGLFIVLLLLYGLIMLALGCFIAGMWVAVVCLFGIANCVCFGF